MKIPIYKTNGKILKILNLSLGNLINIKFHLKHNLIEYSGEN